MTICRTDETSPTIDKAMETTAIDVFPPIEQASLGGLEGDIVENHGQYKIQRNASECSKKRHDVSEERKHCGYGCGNDHRH